jgi:hypothetical protein
VGNQVDSNLRRTEIRPTNKLKWIDGLRAALKSINARPNDPYSWLSKTDDCYVFTAEIDHEDQPRNKFSRLDGTFDKKIKPVSKAVGESQVRIRHAQELFEAVTEACATKMKCQLLIVKGTKYGTTPGGVRAAVDGDAWIVTELSGDVPSGFHFRLERTQ